MSYDGSINIDTRVSTNGMNEGVKNISQKFQRILQSMKNFAQIGGVILGKLFSIAAIALWFAAVRGALIAIRENMSTLFERAGISDKFEKLKTTFDDLKLALANMFLPLITAALPYLQTFSEWLIGLFNKISMITAALLGQKEVLQIVTGEIKKTGNEIEKSIGSLAAFDKINVLDVNKSADNTSVSQVAQMVPVTDDILSKVQEIKDIINSWWNDPAGMVKEIWGNIIEWLKTQFSELMDNIFPDGSEFREKIINPLSVGFFVFVESTKELFRNMWSTITDESLTFPEKIQKIFGLINEWLVSNFKPGIDNIINNLFPENAAGESFKKNVLDPLSVGFFVFVESTKSLLNDLWATMFNDSLSLPEKIKKIWGFLVEWFNTNFGNSIKEIFNDALESIKGKFSATFTDVKKFVKDVINDIIGMINGMVENITGGINGILDSFNSVANIVPGFTSGKSVEAPQIPRLATGAVIPPNSQFAAILGDQRSGNNLEGPESMFRRIVREESGSSNSGQEITIKFEGTLGALVRELKPYIDKENTRVGGSLIRGGTS